MRETARQGSGRQHGERSAAALQDSVKAAAQAIGTATLKAALTRDLGVAWVRRADGGGREIAGISQDLLDAWSGPGSIPQEILASIPDSGSLLIRDVEVQATACRE